MFKRSLVEPIETNKLSLELTSPRRKIQDESKTHAEELKKELQELRKLHPKIRKTYYFNILQLITIVLVIVGFGVLWWQYGYTLVNDIDTIQSAVEDVPNLQRNLNILIPQAQQTLNALQKNTIPQAEQTLQGVQNVTCELAALGLKITPPSYCNSPT